LAQTGAGEARGPKERAALDRDEGELVLASV
jgi:hypothetical protein